jgi:DNA-binding NtrC family response regulator
VEKKILIVDDEPLIRTALSSVFQRDEMTVKTAACGGDALKELNDTRFDLCFIDIHLPDMNGLTIMSAVKAASPETIIVIMTGSDVDAEMLARIRASASLLMAKPFDLDRVRGFAALIFSDALPAADRAADTHQGPLFQNWIEDGMRRHTRYATMHAVSCVEAAGDAGEGRCFDATVIDISTAGMGIRTDYSPKPGHLLEFNGSSIVGRGVVQWCLRSGGSCRAGVRFVEPQQA